MRFIRNVLQASLPLAALCLLTGCNTVVAGTAVRAPMTSDPTSGHCQEVPAPLMSIEQQRTSEPKLRIPQPPGWQRLRLLDSQLLRYSSRNDDLAARGFAPTAVVTLESTPGTTTDPQQLFDREKAGLSRFGATNLTTSKTTLCGYPAEIVKYTGPPMGNIPARNVTTLEVVAGFDDTTYVATLTIQSSDPDNPTYAQDAKTILTGFQILAPDAA
ncbi:LpqN/LpqT family lipoprotein [Mycobacterium sp.]|uniref:LpqN/LpqT family lipoprotein n=1 Tax=Mycobacterium sp. TaxID=1785 RepID=UPI003BA9A74F